MIWWEALWRLVSVLTEAGPTGLLVGTGVMAGVLLSAVVTAGVLLGRRAPVADPRVIVRVLRTRAGRTGVPRHRDPDASGRTRPRGPTGRVAAA
ncbi:DUF6412 domain-containing protein [Actinoplanes sp. NPDC051346]|uniref:DUF6412 domain-containing protein n=1 Tax=Actinoplanes sp. NPDC051346 TaxID=3155048 RepID=UPI00342CEFC4